MAKKLLILGGNVLSCEIVRQAKAMGLYTIVTDWYDTQRSPAKLLADEYWMDSIEDYDTLLWKIREWHIDGIITGFTDSYLLPYQHLCELAGLPCYGTKEQFEILTNKDKYKALCREYGVPTIRQYDLCDSDICYPVLVKPVDGSGSRGITICNNFDELRMAVNAAEVSSKRGKYIIERYMDGREATVFWLFIDGGYYLAAIGNRHVKQNQGDDVIPLPVGYTFPSVFTPKYIKEVVPNAERMFKAMDIRNGMMFMQCKVEDGCCYVYDIGYRLTGSLEYKIFEKVSGFNPLEMLIRFALTGKMTEKDISSKIDPIGMQPSYNVSCLCAPGVIGNIAGHEQVKQMDGVIDVVLSHFPGQTITEQMRGLLAQITVRVLGAVNGKDELYSAMKGINNTIRIISADGKDLSLSKIDLEDIEGFVL